MAAAWQGRSTALSFDDAVARAAARAIDGLKKARLQEEPRITPQVHHYTGFEAFSGIVKHGKLWLSETTYMNDRAELRAFRDACVAAHTGMVYGTDAAPHPRNAGRLGGIDRFRTLAEAAFRRPAYLASLSAHRSLLSQWRAYCPRGGVSLEFDTAQVEQAARRAGFETCWCFYSSLEIRHWSPAEENPATRLWRALHDELDGIPFDQEDVEAYYAMVTPQQRTAEQLRPGPAPAGSNDRERVLLTRLAKAAFEIAPMFKHPAFREEGEFRAYTTALREDAIKLRQGRHGPVRYLELDVGGPIAATLKSVTLGPCDPEHQDALLASLRRELKEAGAPDVPVRPSGIPLRFAF